MLIPFRLPGLAPTFSPSLLQATTTILHLTIIELGCLFKGSISRSLIVQKFLKLVNIDPAIDKRLNGTVESAILLALRYRNVEAVQLLLNEPRVDPSADNNDAIRLAS